MNRSFIIIAGPLLVPAYRLTCLAAPTPLLR